MKNYLLIFIAIIVAAALGFWFGQKKECIDCPPEFVTMEDIDDVKIKRDEKFFQLIGYKEAKALDSNFVLYKKCNLSPELRSFFGTPMDIDSAKTNFTDIFNQNGFAKLRAYPGVKYDAKSGQVYFTMIFIGVDSLGKLIYENNIPRDIRVGRRPDSQPPIQDNNTPCKPCTRLFD